VYADAYAGVDVEWLRAFQLELLYARMSPAARVREHVAANAMFASRHFLEWGNNVFALFARATMLPADLAGAGNRKLSIKDVADKGLGALFAIAGYEHTRAPDEAGAGRRQRSARRQSAADAGHLVLRRVSWPLARFFHIASGDLADQAVRDAHLPPQPVGCLDAVPPFSIGNDEVGCTMFLDLETGDRRRIGVWASNHAHFSNPLGTLASQAPPVLRLPLDARLRNVGSPMVGAPGRSAPAEAVLRALAALCVRRGHAMSKSLAALGPWRSQWASWLPERIGRAVGARAHLAWPGTRPFFPEANQTWYARMKSMAPLADADQVGETAYFGYPQGVPTTPLRNLCAHTHVRFSWRDKVHPGLCSAQMRGPRAAGPGPEGGPTQAICCELTKCKPTDVFAM